MTATSPSDHRPETSTVRSALNVVRAAEGLATGDADSLATHLSTVMREAKQLRADQIDDLEAHLHAIYTPERGNGADTGATPVRPIADAPQV